MGQELEGNWHDDLGSGMAGESSSCFFYPVMATNVDVAESEERR